MTLVLLSTLTGIANSACPAIGNTLNLAVCANIDAANSDFTPNNDSKFLKCNYPYSFPTNFGLKINNAVDIKNLWQPPTNIGLNADLNSCFCG